MADRLNFLLMGNTGHGKSAVGNSILGSKTFKTSASSSSETQEVKDGFSKLGNYILQVVDGPGLADTDKSQLEDTEAAAKNMSKALAMCDGGVDAFLFVLKFGNRFTAEENSTLEALKHIFGPRYMNHVIVVVTHGDIYLSSVEDGESDGDFHAWCRQQDKQFYQLYKDCAGRFVLFNNKEKDERKKKAQIQELVQLSEGLRGKNGHYTSQCFEDAERERNKLIVTLRAPHLALKFQQELSLLTGAIRKFAEQPSDCERQNIRSSIQEVKREIEKQDQGYGVLDNIRELVKEVEENLGDAVKLQSLAKELEEIRKAKKFWTVLGIVCAVVGGVVCLVAGPIAIAAGVATAAATAGVTAGVTCAVAAGEAGVAGAVAGVSIIGAAATSAVAGTGAILSGVTVGVSRSVFGFEEKKKQIEQKEIENKIKSRQSEVQGKQRKD